MDHRLLDHDAADAEGAVAYRVEEQVAHGVPGLGEFELALVGGAGSRVAAAASADAKMTMAATKTGEEPRSTLNPASPLSSM